jgi:hypothetical protein
MDTVLTLTFNHALYKSGFANAVYFIVTAGFNAFLIGMDLEIIYQLLCYQLQDEYNRYIMPLLFDI